MLKRFDLPDPPAPAEPLEFEIAGRTRDRVLADGTTIAGEPFVERFRVVDVVPFGCIDDLARTVEVRPDGEVMYGKHATLAFMRQVIVPDDRDRWNALLTDPERIVPIDHVASIMLWVVGETTDRPTGPRSNSHNGSAAASDGSEAASSSTAGDPANSTAGDSGSGST